MFVDPVTLRSILGSRGIVLLAALAVWGLVAVAPAAAQPPSDLELCAKEDRLASGQAKPGARIRARTNCRRREVAVGPELALCVSSRQGRGHEGVRGKSAQLRTSCHPKRETEIFSARTNQEPEMLFVQSAPSSRFSEGVLTLYEQFDTTYFADRPDTVSGTLDTELFLTSWAAGDDSFEAVPPNADIVCTSPEDGRRFNAVLTLHNPSFSDGEMSYEVQRLSGHIPSECESTSLFIDGGILRGLLDTCSAELEGALESILSGQSPSVVNETLFAHYFEAMRTSYHELSGLLEGIESDAGAKRSLIEFVGAPPQPAEYRPGISLHPAIPNVAYPPSCTDENASTACPANHVLELAMERKYWAILVNTDIDKMKTWVASSAAYAKASDTAYSARIHKLAAMGNVMVYQSFEPCDPRGLSYIIDAVEDIIISIGKNPNNPNGISVSLYLTSLVEFLLEGWFGNATSISGEDTLNRMIRMSLLFGPPSPVYNEGYGSELRVVGLVGFTSLLNSSSQPIQHGLAGADNGQNWSFQRTTSLGPFKQVGEQIELAEAHAALGEREEAEARYAALETWLRDKHPPEGFKEEIEQIRAQLLVGPDALIETWKSAHGLFGSQIRQPFGPAEQPTICRVCHVGGTVPDDYYSWR